MAYIGELTEVGDKLASCCVTCVSFAVFIYGMDFAYIKMEWITKHLELWWRIGVWYIVHHTCETRPTLIMLWSYGIVHSLPTPGMASWFLAIQFGWVPHICMSRERWGGTWKLVRYFERAIRRDDTYQSLLGMLKSFDTYLFVCCFMNCRLVTSACAYRFIPQLTWHYRT